METLSRIWVWLKNIWAQAVQKISLGGELVWVLLGGALGGALAPAVVLLIKSDSTVLATSLGSLWNWFTSKDSTTNMMLGAIAAGITVYVVSKREGDPKKALFFFSVICGLTFQTILTAIGDPNSADKAAIASSEVSADIAKKSGSDASTAITAANVAVDAVQGAPASQVDAATRAEVGANIIKTVTGLEQAQLSATGADQAQFSDAISKIQDAAKQAGYTEVASVTTSSVTGHETKN